MKIITAICILIILATLRIKKDNDGITIQFGLWQLIRNWLNK